MVDVPTSEVEEARRHLIAWLILAFRPPTVESVRELLRADVEDLLRLADLAPAKPLNLPGIEAAEALTDELESEFVRLFVNCLQGKLAHLEATAYGPVDGPEGPTAYLLALMDNLQQDGLAVSHEATEPPDHLTLLLERFYFMDEPLSGELAQHPFVLDFLSGWLPEMLTRLAAAEPPRFYEIAGRVLARLFDLELPSQWGDEVGQGSTL